MLHASYSNLPMPWKSEGGIADHGPPGFWNLIFSY